MSETDVLTTLTIDVLGTPVPQGSKRAFIRGKGATARVTMVEANPDLPAWRASIVAAAQARMALTGWIMLTDAVEVSMRFWFRRPKTVRREYPCVPPDQDKLVRAVFDALTIAQVWKDDGLVVDHSAASRYASAQPGVRIEVRSKVGAVLL